MTLISICQDAAKLAGVRPPDSVVGNSEDTAQRLLVSANAIGVELLKRHRWAALQGEYEFSTVENQPSYDLPSDLDNIMDFTVWDRTNYWRMRGSISPQEWQMVKSGIVGSSLQTYRQYRIKGENGVRKIFFDPTPDRTGDEFVFEYLSNAYCESSGGDAQSQWLADTDMPRLPEILFIRGVHWMLLRSAGQPYIDERADYEQHVQQEIRDDTPGLLYGNNRNVRGFRFPEGSWLQ